MPETSLSRCTTPAAPTSLTALVDDHLRQHRMRVAAAETLSQMRVQSAWLDVLRSAPDNPAVTWLYRKATRT